ncbi:MAG: hypothetical protein A2233_01335 [Candidatus Kerfeldbacteria bacterium RIFOXYA2_FULL_38_24]|uniref:Uncharacterized protein n=1 Tax=Candidatus Kerfeldbacteria bacterium RIFOXYB2_FULL_38_14 TaxID=1798547 RepID=A0A1G2BDT2_9BACT|nr:MAG: hypothetical protein A2233_01335 [Candidatus Kerfeldbacteria bacterium RIFOXYA2_FULL_38_24]OGY87378.1 MAG: hypothetical protein A2319_05425 [Candidatus Kerfeldbacteria bacterium RIFOXYB2_FULL_38_14]OGY89978.1 MAG: hypothetical protein A2458_05600 [Candidatus Kerfeldbacteria bacterium RIFOXYC2_FULL_38_9]
MINRHQNSILKKVVATSILLILAFFMYHQTQNALARSHMNMNMANQGMYDVNECAKSCFLAMSLEIKKVFTNYITDIDVLLAGFVVFLGGFSLVLLVIVYQLPLIRQQLYFSHQRFRQSFLLPLVALYRCGIIAPKIYLA